MKVLYLIILVVCSYLFGNINFAKIISKCKKDDITKHGSGNPGTLNMLRTFGFKWAIFNMTLEICKGVIPTLVAKLVFKDMGISQIAIYVAGVSVILGHIYPVFSKFKGGKGVAAFAGFSFIALPWWVALIILVCCFTFVVITSIGSIGTLGFVLISAIVQLVRINPSNYGWLCYVLLAFVVTLIMYVHRGNIKRLFAGKENPTNIRAAFKKDFKLGKKDEDVEILKEAPVEEVKTQSTETSNIQSNENITEPVKDVKIMSVQTSNQSSSEDNNQAENTTDNK
ncbi:MAG: glycerol-3-phosphate 1-O-acyltransferase PlsY [Clostridia bacterium]|nr:glycerol-3-phosphate 1-O-acyltransferase PlsY [Clostridia bacterium]